jgi:hypothetical protein
MIKKWEEFLESHLIKPEEYVEDNFLRLMSRMGIYDINDISEEEEEELKRDLVNYFKEFPDRISKYNLQTFGSNMRGNHTPILNNIGGVIKYK